jgi:iron complex transport system permease protein
LLPVFLIALIAAWLFARELNILSLGERTAIHLGVPVRHLRLFLLLLSSFLTAIAVSISGIIGFVGLVIPHAVRLVIGADHRWLIPMSSLAGAIFLVWSDCLARTVLEPREIPIGVVTAIVGAPFFAYLLKKQLGAQG